MRADGITMRAGTHVIVDGASFEAPAGALTALLGPNGAGKSTLLRAVAGIDRPDAGTVHAGEDDLLTMPRRQRARLLALVEQESATELPLTVRAVVGLGRTPHEALLGGRDADAASAVDDAMRLAGVAGLAGPDVTSLSGGERQRVMLARALAQQPRILVLDEPTNHLDVAAQLDVLELLRRLAGGGTTVVAALHDLTLAAATAQHVVVMAHGRVVANGPTLETLTPALLREVYGVEAEWTTNPLTGAPLLAVARVEGVSPPDPT